MKTSNSEVSPQPTQTFSRVAPVCTRKMRGVA
jgi:hypothetical protein